MQFNIDYHNKISIIEYFFCAVILSVSKCFALFVVLYSHCTGHRNELRINSAPMCPANHTVL